jgi:hypothetical protein
MKIFKFALNMWITVASLLSFLLGWVVLAHAPKPVQSTAASVAAMSAPAIPTLEPLQPLQSGLDNSTSAQGFQFQAASQPPVNSFFAAQAPIFSSGGS